jgi:hypothetical protein
MRTRLHSSRTVTSVAVLSLVGLLGLSACGGAQSGATGAASRAGGLPAAGPAAARDLAAQDSAAQDFQAGNTGSAMDPAARAPDVNQADLVSGEALIKTGSIGLRSDHIDRVLLQVYRLVGGIGGEVSREESSTNERGDVVRSALVLRVPVARFDSTLNGLSRLGTLVDRGRSSRDVTTAVADTASRVHSAQRAIVTLRRLFHRATQLGDVIRLESELNRREADLESLQAQQRALRDRTTMSTITLTLELPPPGTHPASHHRATGGFVGGIRQGWHALTRTVVAVGHGLGVVLPLGTVLLLLAALGFWVVRRVRPLPTRSAEPAPEA